jgi:hypothetical protein
MRKRVLVVAMLACAITATSASAQAIPEMARRVGIGISVGGISPTDDDVSAGFAAGVTVGLAPATGFGPSMGLGWYEGDLTLARISGDVNIGRLRVRPLMGGVGYTWVNGRVATGASINAGISFNSIRLDDQYRAGFGSGSEVRGDASNSFAARPQLRVEYALARKFGVYSSASYFFTRFDSVLETPTGRFEDEWDGSSFNLFVGLMVYPFK